jgi:hypothetical protein
LVPSLVERPNSLLLPQVPSPNPAMTPASWLTAYRQKSPAAVLERLAHTETV